MAIPNPAIEVLLPAYNEADSIEPIVREIYDELSPYLALQFIITEDGSTDGTKEVLARLSKLYPIKLITSETRKGYGPALIDGMRLLDAPYLLCLDSDGQCDPRDFWRFWQARDTADVLVGWRMHRRRGLGRMILSIGFYTLYQLLYRVPAHDPSFCYVLVHRRVVERLLPELGEMREGFWWEFTGRAHRRRFRVQELPVNHRDRFAGGRTRVYHLSKLPGIGYRHFLALFKVWHQTRP